MTALQGKRLGKKLGVVVDPRTFKAKALLRPDEVKVPREHRIAHTMSKVPVFANDKLGDCTQASIGHAIVTMERSAGQHDIPLTDDMIVQAYEVVGGYVPGDESTDNGAYELDSLNNWRTNGIGSERDGTSHKIKAFAAVEWKDHDEVRLAHYVFGGLKVCAALPLSAADQLDAGEPWDVVDGKRGRLGSWGGHSMYSPGYTREGLVVWTWGQPQVMTWAWVDKYVDECYAVISEDYQRRTGTTPQGFNAEALDTLLANL